MLVYISSKSSLFSRHFAGTSDSVLKFSNVLLSTGWFTSGFRVRKTITPHSFLSHCSMRPLNSDWMGRNYNNDGTSAMPINFRLARVSVASNRP